MEIPFDAIRDSFDPERVPLAWRGLANDPRRHRCPTRALRRGAAWVYRKLGE